MRSHSDLVQDSKLETQFGSSSKSSSTYHTFYERGSSGQDRRVRLEERWRRQRTLGRGAYGTVWLETCKKPARRNGPTVRAVKEILVDSTTANGMDYHLELEAVMKFSHERYLPSFVQSFGWFDSPDAIFITMEYVKLGDLQKYLVHPIPEDETKIIACQLAEGLRHMHQHGFTHRDLKPGNILVVEKGPQWLVQISDFGISRRLRPGVSNHTLGTMRRGTMGFIAPEMLGFVLERDFPHAVDMWSLGSVIFRMLTKELFLTDAKSLQKYASAKVSFPDEKLKSFDLSVALTELLKKLLSLSPKDRPTSSEVLSHKWLSDVSIRQNNPDQSQRQDGSVWSESDLESYASQEEPQTEASAAWTTEVLPENKNENAKYVHTEKVATRKDGMEYAFEGIADVGAFQPPETTRRRVVQRNEESKYVDAEENEFTNARFVIDARGTIYATDTLKTQQPERITLRNPTIFNNGIRTANSIPAFAEADSSSSEDECKDEILGDAADFDSTKAYHSDEDDVAWRNDKAMMSAAAYMDESRRGKSPAPLQPQKFAGLETPIAAPYWAKTCRAKPPAPRRPQKFAGLESPIAASYWDSYPYIDTNGQSQISSESSESEDNCHFNSTPYVVRDGKVIPIEDAGRQSFDSRLPRINTKRYTLEETTYPIPPFF